MEIRFELSDSMPPSVRTALEDLAAAVTEAQTDDDVSGFRFSAPRTPIGGIPTPKLPGPADDNFCLQFSIDSDGNESCTVMWI